MGLLNQPLFNIGLGLMSESGPSYRPNNYGRGVMMGLLNARENRIAMQEQQRAAQEYQMKLARFNMEKTQYDQEQAEAARQAERHRIFANTLPEEYRAAFAADPSSFMSSWNANQLKPPTAREKVQDANGRWRWVDTEELLFPDVEVQPEEMTPYEEATVTLERDKIAASKQEKKEKAVEKQRLADEHSAIVRGSVENAMRQALVAQQDPLAGGPMGSVFSGVIPGSGTKHDTLRKAASTIKSNLALEELTKLKERGGTLGALNTTEFAALEGKISGLNPDGNMDVFMDDLRFIAQYMDIDFDRLLAEAGAKKPSYQDAQGRDSGQGHDLRRRSKQNQADEIVGYTGRQ